MKKKEILYSFITNKDWFSVTNEFLFQEICDIMSFQESMRLAYNLFFQNLENGEIQEYAINLFFNIKKTFIKEWDSDWKNDAFLGKLCSITWRYDEMYQLYKNAYDKLIDPPESLLLLLASCNSAPGTPPISDRESEEYIKRAIKKRATYEATLMMRDLASVKENNEERIYWMNLCNQLEKDNVHTEVIIPDALF